MQEARHGFYGEDIDVYALQLEDAVVGVRLLQVTVAITQFGIGVEITRIGVVALQSIAGSRCLFRKHGEETVIVLTTTFHIDIIVPRYKSAMTASA